MAQDQRDLFNEPTRKRRASRRPSLNRDVGELDHLAPLRGFVGDHLAEFLRRAAEDQHAHLGEPLLDLGVGEAVVDLGVELVDDLARRAARGANAPP